MSGSLRRAFIIEIPHSCLITASVTVTTWCVKEFHMFKSVQTWSKTEGVSVCFKCTFVCHSINFMSTYIKRHLLIRDTHTRTHTLMEQPSGTVWGSVSCLTTLKHELEEPRIELATFQ